MAEQEKEAIRPVFKPAPQDDDQITIPVTLQCKVMDKLDEYFRTKMSRPELADAIIKFVVDNIKSN